MPSPNLLARSMVASPLRRPAGGCLFIGILFVLFGIAFLGHITLWITEPLTRVAVFVGSSLFGLLASIPCILFLRFLDRRERESLWLVFGALLWGAVISTGISAILNFLGYGFVSLSVEAAAGSGAEQLNDMLTAALVAPPVEEMAKGLAILILFWFFRAEFDNVRDGIIYGALVGLGFNFAEYGLYVMKGYIETGTAPVFDQLAIRFVFLGFNGHTLWSAICGAGVGFARQTKSGCLRLVAPVAGYVVAVIGHMLHNSIGVIALALLLNGLGYDLSAGFAEIPLAATWFATAVMNAFMQGGNYLVILTFLILTAFWERSIIRTHLADEVGSTVTPEEYGQIERDRSILSTRRVSAASGRNAQRIADAQNELAFRKWHVAREGGDLAADPLVAAWRQDIMTLRAQG